MGTIAIGLENIDVYKIRFKLEAIYKVESRGSNGKEGFKEYINFKYKGKDIIFAWIPHYKRWGYNQQYKAPDAKLIIHLSQFENYEEVRKVLKHGFGRDYKKVLKGRLLRFDAHLDVNLPIKLLESNCFQKYVRKVSEWESGKRTFYFGNMPRKTCFYEKDVAVNNIDFRKPKLLTNRKVLVTRIEVRLSKYQLPVSTFKEFKKIYEYDLFSHLILKDFQAINTKGLRNSQIYKIEAFQKNVDEDGLLKARRRFNEDGNFEKTIGRHLEEYQIDLNQLYKKKMKRFMRGI